MEIKAEVSGLLKLSFCLEKMRAILGEAEIDSGLGRDCGFWKAEFQFAQTAYFERQSLSKNIFSYNIII